MSATFTTPAGSFSVGGGGTDNPYPRYSISQQNNSSGKIPTYTTYSVSVTGEFIATGDITSTGARAKSIREEIINEFGYNGQFGTLVINGPGGASPLTFSDCKLVSLSAAEQDATSQGVLTQEFTAEFEAQRLNESAPLGDYGTLEAMSESWDWAITEENNGDGTDVYRNYTATLSVSATGRGDSSTQAFQQAKTFVTGRTSAQPSDTNQKDLAKPTAGNYNLTGFPISGYGLYNKVTSRNVNVAAGTYEETITWQYSKFAANVVVDITGNFNETSNENTVDVNATVTGYEDIAEGQTSSRYSNASSLFNSNVSGNLASWASTFYNTYKPAFVPTGRVLQGSPQAQSTTENKTDGVISITATFSDKKVLEGVIDQSVTISDTNIDGGNKVVAILPVIAKSNGPVIQDMATTGERTRTISVDLTMKLDNRKTVPLGTAQTLANPYRPKGDGLTAYRQNRSTSWNPQTGSFNLTEDYVWTAKEPDAYETPDSQL